jgi:NAD(P)-dependent dehydrogenase (short-subunit alcohol dehydrogenase family)
MMAPGRRTALVTGGSRGIGLGIVRALAREGWDVVLCGVREESDVSATLQELRKSGAGIDYVRADVGDREARARLVDHVRSQHGTVNVLVNNAGRGPQVRADLLDASEDSFEAIVRTNLKGPYFLTQAIARDQIQRRSSDPSFAASIVFITSVSADTASINRGEYCVSKAGLAMAAKLFAVRLAGHGIPVYEVRPGIVATDMTSAVKESYDARIAQGLVPEGRWGHPDDVGRVVAALARGDFPYATGTVIHVDGGLALPRL